MSDTCLNVSSVDFVHHTGEKVRDINPVMEDTTSS